MFNRLKEAWRNGTERVANYGVFETQSGRPVIVQVSPVERLPRFQLAQGQQWYWRRFPLGEWHVGGYNLDPRKLRERGVSPHAVREQAAEKFRRYF